MINIIRVSDSNTKEKVRVNAWVTCVGMSCLLLYYRVLTRVFVEHLGSALFFNNSYWSFVYATCFVEVLLVGHEAYMQKLTPVPGGHCLFAEGVAAKHAC